MSKNVPAYLSLVLKVLSRAEKLGLEVPRDLSTKSSLPENNGFCFVTVDGGDAALIIPKHAQVVKWCDLHIDWQGRKGYIGAVDTRGAVVCQVDPSQVDLDLLLTALSGASRATRKGSSKAASQATEEMIAMLKTLGIADDSQPEAPETAPDGEYVEEDDSAADLGGGA